MKPLDFPLFSDENIAPDVVSGLRARGCHVRSAAEENLIGHLDTDVLNRAASQDRVVIAHDLAFGKSAIRAGAPFVGIVYLRPGHMSGDFVLATVDACVNPLSKYRRRSSSLLNGAAPPSELESAQNLLGRAFIMHVCS